MCVYKPYIQVSTVLVYSHGFFGFCRKQTVICLCDCANMTSQQLLLKCLIRTLRTQNSSTAFSWVLKWTFISLLSIAWCSHKSQFMGLLAHGRKKHVSSILFSKFVSLFITHSHTKIWIQLFIVSYHLAQIEKTSSHVLHSIFICTFSSNLCTVNSTLYLS